jgi:hypothetical protein
MSSLRLLRRGVSWLPTPDPDGDPRPGKRPPAQQIGASRPVQTRAVAATATPLIPGPLRGCDASLPTGRVAAHANVIAGTLYAPVERGVWLLHRPMPMATAPLVDGRLGPSAARPPCLACPPPGTFPGARPLARAPPKVTGGRTFATLLRFWRTPKRPPAGLLRRPGPSAAPPPCAAHRLPPPSIVRPCTADEAGLTKAPPGRSPLQAWRPLGVTPPVAHVMPIAVAQQRRAP